MERLQTLLGLSSGEQAQSCRRFAQSVVPYLLVELFLPGGTLLAAALWLFRRRGARAVCGRHKQSGRPSVISVQLARLAKGRVSAGGHGHERTPSWQPSKGLSKSGIVG